MREYVPNELIVDRAVELWKRMLKNPRFDNGDNSFVGGMCAALAMTMPSNVDEEKLKVFGDALKKSLMTNTVGGGSYEYFTSDLSVDYDPCRVLLDAAKEAGLTAKFPWKTSMFLTDEYLSVSCGYGAELVSHYPLSDGRWLMTTLRGSDISKVIDVINGGEPGFVVESREGA